MSTAERRRAKSQKKLRGFLLHLRRHGPDGLTADLFETAGKTGSRPLLIARASPANVRRVMPSIMAAIKASGLPKPTLGGAGEKEVRISEEPGVRLALVLLATGPVRRARRVDTIADEVAGMTVEEGYYWYSKVTGDQAGRRKQALRLLLAP